MAAHAPLRSVGRALTRRQDGVVAIELALGMIPVVLVLVGGITYGGVMATMIALNHAAGEGARAALAGLSLCERKTRAEGSARDALTLPGVAGAATVTSTVTDDRVRVDISYPYRANALTPVLLPVPEMLSASAVASTDAPELLGAC